jgi:hypothetical protein
MNAFTVNHQAAIDRLAAARATHDQRNAEHQSASIAVGAHKNHAATATADAARLTRELANVIANGGDESTRSTLRNQVSDAKTIAEHHAAEAALIEPTIAGLKARTESSGNALLTVQREYEASELDDAKAAYVALLTPEFVAAASRLRVAAQRNSRSLDAESNGALINPSRPTLFGVPVALPI